MTGQAQSSPTALETRLRPVRRPRPCAVPALAARATCAGAGAPPVHLRIPRKRSCQCCGRTFQPLGRWNCRCEECRRIEDQDPLPPRIYADPRPEQEAEEERRKA